MGRPRSVHRCTECQAVSSRWAGRCAGCGAWNSVVEEVERPLASARSGTGWTDPGGEAGAVPLLLSGVEAHGCAPLATGVPELDRVLGGGLIRGSATLIGGEPGIGKSTLLLQALAGLAGRGGKGLIISAEESPPQVRRRAERMGAVPPGLWILGAHTLPAILAAVDELRPDVVVVDSIQAVWDPEIDSPPGSVTQVRECAHRLVAAAKAGGPALVLVGQVTKDGALAGPRLLEHLVDTVLSFEGERHHALRLLRAVKHRFGPVGELGLFEMTGSGLMGVDDPGGLFLGDRRPGRPGSVVFAAMEGQRPLLVEIQALTVSTTMASPRRSASGFDGSRMSLLLAVLDRRAGVSLSGSEVYVSVAGGIRLDDPGADLAVCLALASSATGRPVADDTVVVGEVGLGGEVRQVAHTPRRLAESARLGFRRAVVPGPGPDCADLALHPVSDLARALDDHLGPATPAPQLRLVTGGSRTGFKPGA